MRLFHESERFLKGAESGCSRCLLMWGWNSEADGFEKGVSRRISNTSYQEFFFENFRKEEVDWLQLRFFYQV